MTRQPSHHREVVHEVLIRHIWREHGRVMLAYATQLTRDRAAAEDIVQEALLRAWRHAGKLSEDRGPVRSWLLTVVRNLATDRIRTRAARPPEVGESPIEPAVDDHAEQVVDAMMVAKALSGLIPEHRAVIEHIYLQGRSVDETATRLGIPPGTVKSRTFYALRAMRDTFPERNRATLVGTSRT